MLNHLSWSLSVCVCGCFCVCVCVCVCVFLVARLPGTLGALAAGVISESVKSRCVNEHWSSPQLPCTHIHTHTHTHTHTEDVFQGSTEISEGLEGQQSSK